jgi:hypothetical protein
MICAGESEMKQSAERRPNSRSDKGNLTLGSHHGRRFSSNQFAEQRQASGKAQDMSRFANC